MYKNISKHPKYYTVLGWIKDIQRYYTVSEQWEKKMRKRKSIHEISPYNLMYTSAGLCTYCTMSIHNTSRAGKSI